MNDTFFQNVFNRYSKLKIPEKNKEFYKLDNIVYYQSDIKNIKIVASDVYEIDIHSAFPTICNKIFDKNDPFLIELNKKIDKLDRNKFIGIKLKDTGYLKQLNLIAKMIISSILMDADSEADVFELKKDGLIYTGNSILNSKLYNYYTKELGFQIRITKYYKYVRCFRTSYFVNNDVLIKGVFKDRPIYLQEVTNKLLLENNVNKSELNKIYSNKYFQIIKKNNLDELFLKYYACDNVKYLNSKCKYDKIRAMYDLNIIPKNYLKIFIYPLLDIY